MISTHSFAAERKLLKDIEGNELTSDLQKHLQAQGNKHTAMIWWLPYEFWASSLARDTTTDETSKKTILDTMFGISFLVIVQADITALAAFEFYDKDEIEKSMQISYTSAEGKKQKLSPMKTLSPNQEIVLTVFKPVLASAMGNMGDNMHFFAFNDKSDQSSRLLDPYNKGFIDIQLSKRNGAMMTTNIETPLNSLFVPRKCSNGKDAHISWKYCPWEGERLEN